MQRSLIAFVLLLAGVAHAQGSYRLTVEAGIGGGSFAADTVRDTASIFGAEAFAEIAWPVATPGLWLGAALPISAGPFEWGGNYASLGVAGSARYAFLEFDTVRFFGQAHLGYGRLGLHPDSTDPVDGTDDGVQISDGPAGWGVLYGARLGIALDMGFASIGFSEHRADIADDQIAFDGASAGLWSIRLGYHP